MNTINNLIIIIKFMLYKNVNNFKLKHDNILIDILIYTTVITMVCLNVYFIFNY